MNVKTGYYGMAISYWRMQNMTTQGAINLMNRAATLCEDYNYLMTYIDEERHECILLFQKEKEIKNE